MDLLLALDVVAAVGHEGVGGVHHVPVLTVVHDAGVVGLNELLDDFVHFL